MKLVESASLQQWSNFSTLDRESEIEIANGMSTAPAVSSLIEKKENFQGDTPQYSLPPLGGVNSPYSCPIEWAKKYTASNE